MKKSILTLLSLFAFIATNAQIPDQLEFSDFDNWKDIYSLTAPSGKYQEPLGSTWATSNEASMLFPNEQALVVKTTDRFGGEYAAMIQTLQLGPTIAAGTLFTGRFLLDIINPINSAKFGRPFAYRPVYLKGFYKYLPVNNDSCRIASFLTKWNSSSKKRDTIAIASISYEQSQLTVNSYEEFDIVYNYKSSVTPDSITVMFSSSAGGATFQGGVGSRLYIDEVSLEYFPVAVHVPDGRIPVKIYPNPVSETLYFNSDVELQAASFKVYNNLGEILEIRKLQHGKNEINISHLSKGVYFYSIETSQGKKESGKFIKK